MFGHDLVLTGDDLSAGSSGDLRVTTEEENIAQALGLRLRVRLGELARLGYPAYGSRLYELIGEPNTQRTRVLLMAYARAAVEQDPRVAEVRSVTAIPIERDVVRLSMDVLLISSPNPLNLAQDVSI